MRRHAKSRGFTLIEVVMALTLLAVMLALLFSVLQLALRAWESGSDRARRADQLSLTSGFVRRELALAFPWRFKDPSAVRLAFEGGPDFVRFVSVRPAELGSAGSAFVSFQFARAPGGEGGNLLMRRTFAPADATDFASLVAAEPFPLFENLESVTFSYFGNENDVQPPDWRDTWTVPQRLPSHIRMDVKTRGGAFPEVVVALRLGEEAGCPESAFQRNCVPRR